MEDLTDREGGARPAAGTLGKFAPTSCEGVVAEAQDILGRYLGPGSAKSDRDCIEQLLELLTGR